MTATYAVDGGLTEPDEPKEQLHEHHDEIAKHVDVDVIGTTGQGSKIRRVVLSEETDVSDLEVYLNSSLSLETEAE